jgi:hypothetical protein
MVEGAILEHQHDHVVKAIQTVRCSDSRSPFTLAPS